MRTPYISLFLGLFLALLEIVPAVSCFADACYPASYSTVRKQSSTIKHFSLLSKQSRIEANQVSEETRISDSSAPGLDSLCALLPSLQSNYAIRSCTNFQAAKRLWLLNQRMIC